MSHEAANAGLTLWDNYEQMKKEGKGDDEKYHTKAMRENASVNPVRGAISLMGGVAREGHDIVKKYGYYENDLNPTLADSWRDTSNNWNGYTQGIDDYYQKLKEEIERLKKLGYY